jgi:hypothetical protein
MAKQQRCFAASQSGAAERSTAFRHHIVIIIVPQRAFVNVNLKFRKLLPRTLSLFHCIL